MSNSNNNDQQHTHGAAIAIGAIGGGDPSPAGLKAERIQEVATGQEANPGGTRLKAERIQLALRDLPGWTIQRGGIVRTFELADNREVSRLLQPVAALAPDGELPELYVRRGRVTFLLPTDDDGYLEEPLFEMAKSLTVSA